MKKLPDIQDAQINVNVKDQTQLSWVGMTHILLPGCFFTQSNKQVIDCSIGVNLSSWQQRGIHMSRLYELLENFIKNSVLLGEKNLFFDFHKKILDSHKNLSHWGEIKTKGFIEFHDLTLASQRVMTRVIPIEIKCFGGEHEVKFSFKVELIYSSTCPQSLALSQHVMMNDFKKNFAHQEFVSVNQIMEWLEQGYRATPHAQRSKASIEMIWNQTEWESWSNTYASDGFYESFVRLIKQLELALGTASQMMVKREDEAEFAIQNALHPMFCEDAARKLWIQLKEIKIPQFKGKVTHFESLHPFNVSAQFES